MRVWKVGFDIKSWCKIQLWKFTPVFVSIELEKNGAVLSTSHDRPAAVVYPPVVHEDEASCLLNMATKMMHCLEKKLTRLSQYSFQDQSLSRFLFLINNLYFVWHQLRTNRLLDAPMQALALKIDGYIESYLQVSWAPVLKPLHNNALCCFTGYSAKA